MVTRLKSFVLSNILIDMRLIFLFSASADAIPGSGSNSGGVFHEWLLTGVQVSDQRTLTAPAAGFHTLPQGLRFFPIFGGHEIVQCLLPIK